MHKPLPSTECRTLQFRQLSTRRWFASRKSSRSAFFSAILYDLRSSHPETSIPKLPAYFVENDRFLPAFPSPLLSGYSLHNQTGHGRGLGYEVNFLSTACGTVDEFTICTQAHTSPYSILRGLPRALKLGLFSLKRYRRWTDAVNLTAKRILNELKSGKVSSLHDWKFWWVEIRKLSLLHKLNVRL